MTKLKKIIFFVITKVRLYASCIYHKLCLTDETTSKKKGAASDRDPKAFSESDPTAGVDPSGDSKNTTTDKECELSPLKKRKRRNPSESSVEDDLDSAVAKSIDESEGKPAPKRPSPPLREYNTQESEEEDSFDSSRSSIVPNKCGTDCCCRDCHPTCTSTLNCSCIRELSHSSDTTTLNNE